MYVSKIRTYGFGILFLDIQNIAKKINTPILQKIRQQMCPFEIIRYKIRQG